MRALRGAPTAAAALALSVMIGAPAAAHESRAVGEYTLTVGWDTEPAFADVPNSAEVTVRETETEDPVVEDVELEVEIRFGEETTTLAMEPAFVVDVFGDPGNYQADLVPTRPGTYTFRLFGTIEGEEIDEEFTSGPDTFNDINDPAEAAFPAADPSSAELADRIEAEAARTETAADDASRASTLALVALIVGGLGLLGGLTVGGMVLRRGRP